MLVKARALFIRQHLLSDLSLQPAYISYWAFKFSGEYIAAAAVRANLHCFPELPTTRTRDRL